MERVETEIAVAGAGVVGLAIARTLAQAGRQVAVLEAEPRPGMGVSSRNSEVIHAGFYYRPGSLKARFCTSGSRLLYAYAQRQGVQHKRCGKLVVANGAETGRLDELLANAAANGVDHIRRLSGAEARALEPNLRCDAALHAADSGMINTHQLMEKLQADAEDAGAMMAAGTTATGGRFEDGVWHITAETGGAQGRGDEFEISCGLFINAAGLGAQTLSQNLGLPAASLPLQRLGKGNYFKTSVTPPPFEMLIYPLPAPGSHGLHARLDFDGVTTIFGPNYREVELIDYNVDMSALPEFEAAIGEYWDGAAACKLQPDYAGIRPKLKMPPGVFADFDIQGPRQHGRKGLIALYGIDSPGLTSSLAIAGAVARQLGVAADEGTVDFPFPLF